MSAGRQTMLVEEDPNLMELRRAAFEWLLKVYCTHRVPTVAGPPGSEEGVDGRAGSSSGPDPLVAGGVPDEPSAPDIGQAAAIRKRRHEAFVDLMDSCEAYTNLASRLGLGPEQVEGYLRQERRILASLYSAAREPAPSADRLLRLAYQLALDARAPVEGSLRCLVCERHGSSRRVGVYDKSEDLHRGLGLPPSSPPITALSPLTPVVFEFLERPVPDTVALAAWIELVYHGQPQPGDTPEATARVVEYVVENAILRLWAAGVEVKDIARRDEQAILKYFCRYPTSSLSGKALEERLKRRVKNPSQGARRIQSALRVAVGPAGDWFLRRPLRWADGISVRKRNPRPH